MPDGDALAAFLAARCGKLTASRAKDAFAVLKNGQPAKSRSDLIRDLLAERLTQSSVRHFVNDAMVWGQDTEPEGKSAWEAKTGEFITPCGTYDHPSIDMLCATPDGLIGADGLFELKCPTTPTFVAWLLAGVVPEEHKPQMLIQMACTGRKWCEFAAYDPRVKKMSPLFMRRFEPKAGEIEAAELAASLFLSEVDQAWEILTTGCAA